MAPLTVAPEGPAPGWTMDSSARRARRSTTTLAHAEAPVPKPRARVPVGAIARGPGNHEGGAGRRTTPLPLFSPRRETFWLKPHA